MCLRPTKMNNGKRWGLRPSREESLYQGTNWWGNFWSSALQNVSSSQKGFCFHTLKSKLAKPIPSQFTKSDF